MTAQIHAHDADCATHLDAAQTCAVCRVTHADEPACACGGRAYHRPGCAESEIARDVWDQAFARINLDHPELSGAAFERAVNHAANEISVRWGQS